MRLPADQLLSLHRDYVAEIAKLRDKCRNMGATLQQDNPEEADAIHALADALHEIVYKATK